MNAQAQTVNESLETSAADASVPRATSEVERGVPTAPLRTLLAIPIATLIAFAIHLWASKNQPASETRAWSELLAILFGAALLAAILQRFWPGLRRWMDHMCPIIAAAILLLTLWEIITSGFHWLPMPYFPGPAGVLQSLINDRALLFESTWHSLFLLVSGYALGIAVALVMGVCIGWFRAARYWGMPLLKILGPIPATAWVPLAMVVSPSREFSAIGLIALAVWFPVTM
ncbi:MAG: ABC transporter permease, partial [Xanthobacteraceae bacterium]